MFFSYGNFGLFLEVASSRSCNYKVTATYKCKSSQNHVSASCVKLEDEKADVSDGISIIDIRKDPKNSWNENSQKSSLREEKTNLKRAL